MPLENILHLLDAELIRLRQARTLLAATGKVAPAIARALPATQKPRRHTLSAETRRAISQAQRKRWAAQKQKA